MTERTLRPTRTNLGKGRINHPRRAIIDLVRGRGDADTTESQRDMLDLTMTNAWSATTTASTRTRHRGTDELSEI